MSTATSYLQNNADYWNQGYTAPNVESFVFRVYGRIFKAELGIDGSRGERLLDFGCGQGAALAFFKSKGYDVYGVDISSSDIQATQQHMPDIKDHFKVIDSKPTSSDAFHGGDFDIVTAIQSMYYYSDTDMEVRLQNLYSQMKTGGIIYATMMGSQNWYYDHSVDAGDGLRKVDVTTERVSVNDYYVNFVESEEELLNKFHMFEKIHVGFYDAVYREDEGSDHHYTFVGRKK